jgi:GNAT superfamily N-acetyltransferase
MDGKLWLELLGYVASVLVAISLTMSRIVRLRVINLVGSIAFTIYGVLIGAVPVAAVNAFIVCINVWYLWKMLRAREYFRILEIRPDSEYLHYFLELQRGDVRRYVPAFSHAPAEGELTFFVLRDLVPAGLFIGDPKAGGRLRVRLDYVTPAFRDFKVGHYLFTERAEFFRARGIREIVTAPGSPDHNVYLRKMGFVETEGGEYRLRLA